jgi:hypothetical protein
MPPRVLGCQVRSILPARLIDAGFQYARAVLILAAEDLTGPCDLPMAVQIHLVGVKDDLEGV